MSSILKTQKKEEKKKCYGLRKQQNELGGLCMRENEQLCKSILAMRNQIRTNECLPY